MTKCGYIYIRENEWLNMYNLIKMGITENLVEREGPYTTVELKKGKFVLIFEIEKSKLRIIDNLLKFNFKDLNVKFDGGTEFYKKEIKNEIEVYFDELKIKYKKLNENEINELNRKYRIKKLYERINKIKLIEYLKNNKKNQPIPHNYQIDIIDKIILFFKNNDIGKILWSCGLGKTLLSIFICKKMNIKNICIGVPSKYLQNQFLDELLKFYEKENILFVGGNEINSTTNKETIKTFIKNNSQKIIVTTYSSCFLLIDNEIKFDIKIGDECHHLVGIENEENKGYKEFHKITSNKTLFMTATEKNIEIDNNKIIYTMNNVEQFGDLIDYKSVKWAIENNKITDYNLLIIGNKEKEVDEIIKKINLENVNKELFISAFMSLKSIEKYENLNHVLICCNTTENTDLINDYVNKILDKNIINIDKNKFYNNSLHTNKKVNLKINDENSEVTKFKNSKYGIISSVYLFGEGFDLPKLTGVVFAENMYSDIRILQTSLRSNRLDKENPNKKAFIILPHIEESENSFNKIRIVIAKLRNSDEIIEQKINYLKLNNEDEDEDQIKNDGNIINKKLNYKIIENEHELKKIKLRLKTSKSLLSNNSEEQDEYDYVKEINKSLNIKSKEEYITEEIKNKHENYIENPFSYFYLKAFWKNWYDYLGIDTNKFLKTKEEWKIFCEEKNVKSLEDYDELCKEYDFLPQEPEDYYTKFSNIKNELGLIKRRK